MCERLYFLIVTYIWYGDAPSCWYTYSAFTYLCYVYPSVHLSARISASPARRISIKFDIGHFMKISREIANWS